MAFFWFLEICFCCSFFPVYSVDFEEVATPPSATLFAFSCPLEVSCSDSLASLSEVSFVAFSESLASSASDWFLVLRLFSLSVDDSIVIISSSPELLKSIFFCFLAVVFLFAWGSGVNGFSRALYFFGRSKWAFSCLFVFYLQIQIV